MAKQEESIDDEDEMRSEYDLDTLKFIGRGIYAERLRRRANLAQLIERDLGADDEQSRTTIFAQTRQIGPKA